MYNLYMFVRDQCFRATLRNVILLIVHC